MKSFKIHPLLFAGFFVLTGCSMHHRAIYDIELSSADRSAIAQNLYGDQRIFEIENNGIKKHCFEDGFIKIIWHPTPDKIYFTLWNKSDQSIQIHWPQAVFFDIDGKNHRVAYSDIDFKNKPLSQDATSILMHSNMSFAVLPADHIIIKKKKRQSRYAQRVEKYKILPFLPNQATVFSNSDKLWEKAKKHRGKTFGIMLPISDNLKTYEYIFTFEVLDAYIRPAE